MFATALVTGATGLLGRRVVHHLKQHARSVRIGARDLSRVAGFPRMGFDVAFYDHDLPASWEGALAQVDRLLLMPPPVDPFVDQRLIPLVERAVQLGVRRVVLVSHIDAPHEPALTALEHAVVRHSPEWSILRPTWLVDTVLPGGFLHPGVVSGQLVAPTGEGRLPWVVADDVAQAATHLLTHPSCTARVVQATGAQGLSFRALSATLAQLRGAPVAHVDIDPEVFGARLLGPRWPVPRVQLLLQRLERIRLGEAEVVSNGLTQLLGREPTSVFDRLRLG